MSSDEALKLPSADYGAKHASLPRFPEGGAPRRGHATPDESFVRHDTYFFKDGNVTFLIHGTLYCVHRYFFSRDSVYFSTRFAQLGIHDHEALPSIISIGDVERNEFEALLSVLYPTNFEAHALTYDQWKSVLHLSTRWDFASLRKLALKSINPPTPHDQLVLARTYSVEHWVVPALTALCSRMLPLSLNEARQMSMEDVILVAMVREEIRGGALQADIPRNIAKTKVEAQLAKLEAETMTKVGAEAEAKANASTEAEAETREEHDADAKAKTEAEAEARVTAEAEGREKQEAKAEVDAKIVEEAIVKAAKEAKAAAEKAELKAKQKAEQERLVLEAKCKAEAMRAKAKAEEDRKRAEEIIARQRAADKAARAAAATATSAPSPMSTGRSSGGNWFSKISAASAIIATEEPAPPLPKPTNPWAKRQLKNASFPSTELGPLRGPGGPSAPIQHSSTTCTPHGSVSTHLSTSLTAAPSSAIVKPTLRLDRIREATLSSTMSASGPEGPADVPWSSSEKGDDDEALGAQLTMRQKKRMREMARRQAQRYEKNCLPPSWANPEPNSVGHPVVQEPKLGATALRGGEGEGVLVDARTESGKDGALVIVDEPRANTTTAETAAAHAAADDEWLGW